MKTVTWGVKFLIPVKYVVIVVISIRHALMKDSTKSDLAKVTISEN